MRGLLALKFELEFEKALQIALEMALQIMVFIFIIVIEIVILIMTEIVNLVYLGMLTIHGSLVFYFYPIEFVLYLNFFTELFKAAFKF